MQRPILEKASQAITRRAFLGTTAAGAAALAVRLSADTTFPWNESTIPILQAAMASGSLTSRELTLGYLHRIASLNPLLHAVIETNPNAVSMAEHLDDERHRGILRGPLHGIPVLLKDNIATDDNLQTTAGSLALLDSHVPADATVVAKLRNAGAVIIGKGNLGEWANFRGDSPSDFPVWSAAWSARGGETRNPYLLSYTTYGSSSGPAVAVAANLCSVAVGTETDGSITTPANANLVVGLKPTLGLISQNGIIPISHNQDTAGPICRTITDLAILLGVLQSPFGPVLGHAVPSEYTHFLKRGALKGARIGVDRRFFDQFDDYTFSWDDDALPYCWNAVRTMAALGATLVDTDTGDIYTYSDDEFSALQFEFKVYIAQYLAGLTHTEMRTLADLIAFNTAHCPEEMRYFGQEIFEAAESTDGLNNPVYLAARANAVQSARSGIDGAIARDKLDAIVAPHDTNTSAAAAAGYPNLALPVGITPQGKPAGILIYSTFLHEPQLLAFGYDLEQALNIREQPRFLGVVASPGDAGICTSRPPAPHVVTDNGHRRHRRHF